GAEPRRRGGPAGAAAARRRGGPAVPRRSGMTAAGALVLSSDEVRILGGLAGAGHAEVLVPDSGWAAEDQPVADVVATRGLLARGLIRLDTPAVAPHLVLAPAVRGPFRA